MCNNETRIDTGRYWEKRRVQVSLRRMLEALQERFSMSDEEFQAERLGGVVYDALMAKAQDFTRFCGAPNGLDEKTFTRALDNLSAWPPEMSEEDRSEVFLALTVPSSNFVGIVASGQPPAKELTKRMFCEGLSRVPYNVPDFPVPTHLLSQQPPPDRKYPEKAVAEVAQSIAGTFSTTALGLDHVKDFFLCGLLSLEEIQVALPRLVPQSLVEEAIMKIIRKSATYFTQREWHKLVTSVRMHPEGEVSTRQREPEQPTLESPPRAQEPLPPLVASPVPKVEPPRECEPKGLEYKANPDLCPAPGPPPKGTQAVSLDSPSVLPPSAVVMAARPGAMVAIAPDLDDHGDSSPELPSSGSRPLPPGARTEPLPYRDIPKEPVTVLSHEVASSQPYRGEYSGFIVDWSSIEMLRGDSQGGAAPSGHQADEGAGTPQAGSSILSAAEIAQATQTGRLGGDDPVAWISLEMQNECHGPYLARAFQRCCQLYEARRDERRAAERKDS